MTLHDLVLSFGRWPNPRYNYLVVNSDRSILFSNRGFTFDPDAGHWVGDIADSIKLPDEIKQLPVDWHNSVAEWADFH